MTHTPSEGHECRDVGCRQENSPMVESSYSQQLLSSAYFEQFLCGKYVSLLPPPPPPPPLPPHPQIYNSYY